MGRIMQYFIASEAAVLLRFFCGVAAKKERDGKRKALPPICALYAAPVSGCACSARVLD